MKSQGCQTDEKRYTKTIGTQTLSKKYVSKFTQTNVECNNVATQTSCQMPSEPNADDSNCFEKDIECASDLDASLVSNRDLDPDYSPKNVTEEENDSSSESQTEEEMPKTSQVFFVFWSALVSLLKRCLVCTAPACIENVWY